MERREIYPGLEVEIVLKRDQHTGRRTRGIVKEILTRSASHPHGIKVRLQDGRVGRVQRILG
ncbi:MAG: YwbE family protein [Methanothrix sp.]|nr:YwbE family protein [Methanothrix sp.]